jgi:hypothetical protein
MSANKKGAKNVLRAYEWTNLFFYLVIFIALGTVIMLVFRSYSNPEGGGSESSATRSVILSEVLTPTADMCIFYLGADVSETSGRYRRPEEIPDLDSGLIQGLLALSGVVEVEVKQSMIVLHKSPSSQWGSIQSGARELINKYLLPQQ